MESVQHNQSRLIHKKNVHIKHVVGFPISSQQYRLLHDPAAQYQLLPSPSKHYHRIGHGRVNSVITKMIKLGESMDIFAQGIREQVRLAPKLSDAVKGKMSLGLRILQVGGVEKVFKQKFNIKLDDEKLFKCFSMLFINNIRANSWTPLRFK